MSDSDDWLIAEDAADILRVSQRQVYRYGQGETPKLRTRTYGRRTLFARSDVETLATELHGEKPSSRGARAELVAPGPFLDHITELQRRLEDAAARIGYLQGKLEQQQLALADQRDLYQHLAQLEQERDQLQQRIAELEQERQQRPWWRFW